MKKQMSKWVAGLLVGLMTLTAAGCGSKDNAPAADGQQAESALKQVAVTYVKAPLNVPSIVEKIKPYWQKTLQRQGRRWCIPI